MLYSKLPFYRKKIHVSTIYKTWEEQLFCLSKSFLHEKDLMIKCQKGNSWNSSIHIKSLTEWKLRCMYTIMTNGKKNRIVEVDNVILLKKFENMTWIARPYNLHLQRIVGIRLIFLSHSNLRYFTLINVNGWTE